MIRGDDGRAADHGRQSGFFVGHPVRVGPKVRNRGIWLLLALIISGLALLVLLRCGGDGDGGGIAPGVIPSSTTGTGYIDGVVYDASDDTPLEGARVTAKGVSGSVTSDAEGKFFFPVTGGWDYLLTIEKPGYTYAQRRARGVVGRDVAVEPVYLVPLDPSVTRIGPGGGTHRDSSGRIEITFPAGAVSGATDVGATMFDRGRDLPYPLPPLSKFTVALNLKPDNLVLAKPAKLRIDNFLGFPAGTPIPVGIYTRESGGWVADGMGVITADGRWVEYELSHFSNLDCNLPAMAAEDSGTMGGMSNETSEENHRCREEGVHGSAKVGLKTGNLYLANGLPRYRSLGIWRGVTLEYNSLSARPVVTIAAEAELDSAETLIPETIGFTVSVEGIHREVTFEGDEGRARFAFHFDGRNARGELLPTGSYPFRVDISSDYRGNYYTAAFFGGPPLEDTGVSSRETFPLNTYYYGRLPLHNESQSPYGSGWGVRGLQRLYIDSRGESVLVTGGSTSAGVFVPVGTYHEMEPPCVVYLEGMGIDRQDRVYFTGEHRVWRREADGGLVVVAGTGEFGFGGDGGPATEAKLWSPTDVAFDSRGNMYIADTGNDRIRRVNTSGIITTVAGSGETGFGGDGGPATEAKLFSPTGVAVDASGNLYIVDSGNHRIRRVDSSGIITTYAGGGAYGSVGDGGPATEAWLSLPNDMALDFEGNLYIADRLGNRIRKVGTDGIITTVAGTGMGGFSGNGGAAVNAQIWNPYDVAVDREGNLYIADFENYRIRKVDRRGIITTWVGGGRGYTVDGMPATEASIHPPHAIAMDSKDTLYIGQLPRFGRCYPVARVDHHLLGEPHEVHFDSPRGDFTKLRQNSDLTFTRTLKDGTEIHFDRRGLHTETLDLNGNATRYGYDDEDRLVTITDPRGQLTRFEYENGGKLSRIIDPTGRETRFSIDSGGDLVFVTDPAGAVTSYSYEDHLLVSSTDPQNHSTDYLYDPHYGRLMEVHYPTGEVRSFSHSDIQGLINDLPPGVGTPENPAPLVRPQGITDSFVDGEQKTWSFRTDHFGRIIEREDPIGRVTRIERDLDSLPTRIELPNGEVFQIGWDERGNPVVINQQSIEAMTSIGYYPIHNKVEYITDAEYHTSNFTYDGGGNLTDFWDAEWNHYHLTYDQGGLLASVTDPLEKTTTFTHNELGNIESVIDPLGNTATYGYDDAGNIATITDANGNTNTYLYDAKNRLTEVTDAEGNITTYTYEEGCSGCGGSGGLLSSITDATGNTTTFTYDEVGELREVIQPLGQTKTFAYYLNRKLKSITTPNADLISFIYDDAGQLVEKRLPEGTIHYAYDDGGNLASVDNAASIINMIYDLAGRLIDVDTSVTPHQPATTVGYGYDKVGNRLSMIDGTATTAYLYDQANRLTDLTGPG
ncbi:MAG: carboxypeptidase regulatory-like domain-containing protein, partial [Thermodesulfobacteriota bacterium]